MPEWLVERGIGEDRALLINGDRAYAARLDWPGGLAAGLVEDAVLTARTHGSARGTVRFASGEDALIDRLPRQAAEGAVVRAEVTRAAMGERSRTKRAQARPTALPLASAPDLAEGLAREGHAVRPVRRFPGTHWEDIWQDAWSVRHDFSGGSLDFAPTPAMLLIDIDGTLPPRDLALAAVAPLAEAIARFDCGGSIGIDFPSLSAKADRRAVDAALGEALGDWPHERTAMNGFGFVQLVARLSRPSLLQRIAGSRAEAAARLLLRRAEAELSAGPILLTCHPAIAACLRPDWLDELSRRTGRAVRVIADQGLALDGGFAQAVAP